MANPFCIEIFSQSGDPQGIRIIHKKGWSGIGVAFPRESIFEVIKGEDAQYPGVYILVSELADETIYIGEADPISTRLKQHLQKDWSWGVFFTAHREIGKTEVKFLESELYRIAKDIGKSTVVNKNIPPKPHMSPQSQVVMNVFLDEILLILPIVGIRAFTAPKISAPITESTTTLEPSTANDSGDWDTIVIPAREEGFQNVFLGENCWYAIRINAKEISKFKYIAAYQVAPISAITHIAEIKEIVPYENSGKYLVRFKAKASPLDNLIRLEEGRIGSQPQSPRYTTYEKIMKSTALHELWE